MLCWVENGGCEKMGELSLSNHVSVASERTRTKRRVPNWESELPWDCTKGTGRDARVCRKTLTGGRGRDLRRKRISYQAIFLRVLNSFPMQPGILRLFLALPSHRIHPRFYEHYARSFRLPFLLCFSPLRYFSQAPASSEIFLLALSKQATRWVYGGMSRDDVKDA